MSADLDTRPADDPRSGDLCDAGWHALRAAWACEDVKEGAAATGCFELTAELWHRCLEGGLDIVGDGPAASLLVLADVERRAGRFEDARRTARRALSGRPNEPYRSLLEYELELVTAGDLDRHSSVEMLG